MKIRVLNAIFNLSKADNTENVTNHKTKKYSFVVYISTVWRHTLHLTLHWAKQQQQKMEKDADFES